MGAVTNKSCAVRDGRGLGWIGGCEQEGEKRRSEARGGEGSFPRKSKESLWIIKTISMYRRANGVQTDRQSQL